MSGWPECCDQHHTLVVARFEPWEGPFADPNQRLPQHPEVAAQLRAAHRAWRERHKRAREAEKWAAERGEAAGADVAA